MFLSCRASATPRLDLTRVASTSPRPPSSPRYLLSPPVFSSSNLRFPPLLRNLLRNLSYLVHAIDASHRGKKIIKNGHPLSRVWKAARPCNTFGAGSSSSVDPTIPRVCISVRGTTTRIDGLLEDRESRSPADAISLPAFLPLSLFMSREWTVLSIFRQEVSRWIREKERFVEIGGFAGDEISW